jgi:DNA-binding NarL/FixJ family response regulator
MDRLNRTRILIADSMTIFRGGVRNLLAREDDFVVLEAEDFGALSQLVDRECPDIALIDLELRPFGGVAAVAWIAERCDCHVIVWSFAPNRETVLAAVRAGASGYLHKEISPTGLVRALNGVIRGEAPLSRDLATLMIEAIHGLEERDRACERAAALSTREREVLELVSQGARNKQIASALTISEFTVKRHMQNILHKLELPSRRAAAALYRSTFDHRDAALTQTP